MTYRIEISPTAIHDIEQIFLCLKVNAPEKSYRWVLSGAEKSEKRC